jgi:hypothetical protein
MTGIPVAPGELVDVDAINEFGRGHWRKTTSEQVVNTVTATDLLNGEVQIDAGAMGDDKALRLTAWGDLLNNSGATKAAPRFQLRFGGSTILDTGAPASQWGASAGRFYWRIVAEILNLGADDSQWASMAGQIGVGASASAGSFTTGHGAYTTVLGAAFPSAGIAASIDTTVACALELDVVLPASASTIDVTLQGALVEII